MLSRRTGPVFVCLSSLQPAACSTAASKMSYAVEVRGTRQHERSGLPVRGDRLPSASRQRIMKGVRRRMDRHMDLRWMLLLGAVACGGKSKNEGPACGPGTTEVDGVCVQTDAGPDSDADTDSASDSGTDSDSDADCIPPAVDCFGDCVSLATDPSNCGGCGIACEDSSRGTSCSEGDCACGEENRACAGSSDDLCCPVGESSQCIDVRNDDAHCGSCEPCPDGEFCVNGSCISCGDDCWGDAGCLTDSGRCIRFTCRAGDDVDGFCSSCFGWVDVSYADWMAGFCLEVDAKFKEAGGPATACNGAPSCCGDDAACSGDGAAWHIVDGDQVRMVGPHHAIADLNCNYWDLPASPPTQLSVCERPL